MHFFIRSKVLLYLSSLALVVLYSAFVAPAEYPIHVYMIGDSTMADKPGTPEENPERGWGQLFPNFFDNHVIIDNRAVNGRSTKSFLEEGRWDSIMNVLQSGDYVFIQFCHNDTKITDPRRYTNPWTGYRRNMEKFVSDAKSKGAHPVILSPIVRRYFNDEGTLTDSHGAYPFVARVVAEQAGIPFIDMQLLTEDYLIALGPDESKKIYLWAEPGEYPRFPEGVTDNTHLNLKGATAYAHLVAHAIREMDLPLAQFVIND